MRCVLLSFVALVLLSGCATPRHVGINLYGNEKKDAVGAKWSFCLPMTITKEGFRDALIFFESSENFSFGSMDETNVWRVQWGNEKGERSSLFIKVRGETFDLYSPSKDEDLHKLEGTFTLSTVSDRKEKTGLFLLLKKDGTWQFLEDKSMINSVFLRPQKGDVFWSRG